MKEDEKTSIFLVVAVLGFVLFLYGMWRVAESHNDRNHQRMMEMERLRRRCSKVYEVEE